VNDQEAIPPEVLKVARALVAGGLDLGGAAAQPKEQRQKPYRVAEVADLLDVHRATVYRDIDARRCGAYRIGEGSGAIRIPVEDFEDYKALLKSQAARQDDAVAS
jgi:excisionase family DNA binding protein